VYHPVAIHRDLDHVHSMVTRHTTDVLHPMDRLILMVDVSPDASSVPSSISVALADPHWCRAMEEEYAALHPLGTNVVTDK
jgi:hypothetical protein